MYYGECKPAFSFRFLAVTEDLVHGAVCITARVGTLSKFNPPSGTASDTVSVSLPWTQVDSRRGEVFLASRDADIAGRTLITDGVQRQEACVFFCCHLIAVCSCTRCSPGWSSGLQHRSGHKSALSSDPPTLSNLQHTHTVP